MIRRLIAVTVSLMTIGAMTIVISWPEESANAAGTGLGTIGNFVLYGGLLLTSVVSLASTPLMRWNIERRRRKQQAIAPVRERIDRWSTEAWALAKGEDDRT